MQYFNEYFLMCNQKFLTFTHSYFHTFEFIFKRISIINLLAIFFYVNYLLTYSCGNIVFGILFLFVFSHIFRTLFPLMLNRFSWFELYSYQNNTWIVFFAYKISLTGIIKQYYWIFNLSIYFRIVPYAWLVWGPKVGLGEFCI